MKLRNGAQFLVRSGAVMRIASLGGIESLPDDPRSFLSNAGQTIVDFVNSNSSMPISSQLQNSGLLRFENGGIQLGSGFALVSTGVIELRNQFIDSSSGILNVTGGQFFGPGTIRGGMILGDARIFPGSPLMITQNFILSSPLASINFTILSVSIFSQVIVGGNVRLNGRAIIDADQFDFMQFNVSLDVMKFGSRDSDFNQLIGCSGLFQAKLSSTNFALVPIPNATIETVFVSPTGSDASCCGTEDNPCGSIQFTIDTIGSDRLVRILAGTLRGPGNCDIRTGGGIVRMAGSGRDDTILDCEYSARAFSDLSGSAQISDMTLRNGLANAGGAVFIAAGQSPQFSKMTFEYNRAIENGGAVFISGANAQPTFIDVQFLSNSATNGGGFYVNGQSFPIVCNYLSFF